jgi:hypothetical protein
VKALFVLVLAALAAPGVASAHGRAAPVATNFEARITSHDAVAAKVVDGDQMLWLRANPGQTVLVPGAAGEPLLRFDPRGVFVNLRSLTAQADRIDRFDLRPLANAQPLWRRLTRGRAFAWHEHRLHALEPLARGRSSPARLGSWSVPLVVDGRRRVLAGVLDYRPPGRTWLWLSLTCGLALAASAAALRSGRTAVALALAATPVIWAVRIARELYGRPGVGVVGYLEVIGTSAVGVWILYGLLSRTGEVRVFTALLTGLGGLYQGLTMLSVLTHAIALTLLPTTIARVLVLACLGLGAGALVGGAREQLR